MTAMPGKSRKGPTLVTQNGLDVAMSHGRAALLRRLHEHVFDRRFRRLEAVPTGGMLELDGLRVRGRNKAQATHYAPTPRLIVHWVHQALPRDLTGWTFVDVGAGRGRVLLVAAAYPYRRVIGVEFADQLAEAAARNVAAYPDERIAARTIEVVRTDALAFDPPHGPTVYFVFNPFGEPVMRRFIHRIGASHADAPRPIVCALVNPKQETVLHDHGAFERLPLGPGLALKTALLSPYRIALYGTAEAAALLDQCVR